MIEFFRSFFRTAEDRLNHPIVGAVVVSWTIWNWKSIAFFALAKAEVYYRINFIKETYSNPYYLDVFAPIFIALVYVSVLPYVSQGVEYITSSAVKAAIKSEKAKKQLREATDENLTVDKLIAEVGALSAEKNNLIAKNIELEKGLKEQIDANTLAIGKIRELESSIEEKEMQLIEGVVSRKSLAEKNEELRRILKILSELINDLRNSKHSEISGLQANLEDSIAFADSQPIDPAFIEGQKHQLSIKQNEMDTLNSIFEQLKGSISPQSSH